MCCKVDPDPWAPYLKENMNTKRLAWIPLSSFLWHASYLNATPKFQAFYERNIIKTKPNNPPNPTPPQKTSNPLKNSSLADYLSIFQGIEGNSKLHYLETFLKGISKLLHHFTLCSTYLPSFFSTWFPASLSCTPTTWEITWELQ